MKSINHPILKVLRIGELLLSWKLLFFIDEEDLR